MQDGSRSTSKGLYICTDGFTLEDVIRVSQYLKFKSRGNFRIYVLVKSIKTVKSLILPFMHKTMYYKLGL